MTHRGYERRARPAPRGRVLAWVILGVLFVAVLVGLFLLGTRIPMLFGAGAAAVPEPTETSSPTPTADPTPTPRPEPTALALPGTYPWDELYGGECLDDYTSAWQETYTVVTCDEPHEAQLVARASLNADPAAAYPGEQAILEQLALLCTGPEALDPAASTTFSWLQWQASYPPDQASWDDGVRDYACFVSRSSGELLTGSVMADGETAAQPAE